MRGLFLGSLALLVVGFVLGTATVFPDVRCFGDFCLISENVFTWPALLMGIGLGIAAAVLFLRDRWTQVPAAKR